MMKFMLILFSMVVVMFSLGAKAQSGLSDAYGFSFTSIVDEPVKLSDYEGRAILIVNTASKCGFTKQYEGLQKLYETYHDRGLVIIGVPSNDFGGQEPGTEAEIKQFCEGIYKITFPMMSKEKVSGKDAHPFYKWAAAQKKGGLIFSTPRWNFHKYLIAPDGTLAASFGSQVTPESSEILSAVEAVLPKISVPSTP